MSNLATIVNNILADSGIDDINVVVTTGSYANPAWITSLAWTKITGAPSFVTGTGTTNYLPKFTSASAIGDSALREISGNLGLGVAPSNWSNIKALQIGSTSVGGFSNTGYFNANAFYNTSTDWTYVNSSFAARYELNSGDASVHAWFVAPSGTAGNTISFTQAMTLTASGQLGINNPTPTAQLHIRSGGTYTNTDANNRIIVERDAHTYLMFVSPNEFDQGLHFAKTTGIVGRIAYHQRAAGDFLSFTVASVIRMTLFNTGNLYLGSSAADAGFRLEVDGTSRFQGISTFTGQTVAANGSINIDSADPAIRFRYTGGTANARIYEWRGVAGGGVNDRMELRLWNDAQTSSTVLFTVSPTGAGVFSSSVTATGTGLNASIRINNTTASTGKDWHQYSLNNGNFGLYNNTDGSYAYLITPNGNMGLGVTPPAWFLFRALNINGSSVAANGSSAIVLSRNWYFDGGEKYYENGTAQRLELVANGFFFQTATTNSSGAGAALTWGSPMTLLSTGNLLLNKTTDSGERLQVNGTGRFNDSVTVQNYLYVQPDAATGLQGLYLQNNNNGGYGVSIGLGLYGYVTSAFFNTLRIESSYPGFGRTLFWTKAQSNSTEVLALTLDGTGTAVFGSTITATKGYFSSNGATDSTTAILANASTNDSTTYAAIFGSLNAGYRMVVRADGNVGISTATPFSLLHVGTRPGAGTTNPSLGSIATVSNDGLTGIDLGANVNANNVVGHINWVNYLGVGNYNTARIDVYADGASNSGSLRFWTASVSSSPTVRLTIASTGAATFSSSVTAGGGFFSSNISSLTYEPSSAGAIQPGVSEFISTGFNVAGASSVDISTISLPSNTQWKAIITGGFANNFEGGGLPSPSFSRDIDGTNNTISVGSVTLTFSRNASTGKLQVSNANATYRATFTGTIHLVTFPQSSIPTNTRAFFGNVGIGIAAPLSPLHIQTAEPTLRIVDSNDSGVMFIGNTGGFSYIRAFGRNFRFLNSAGVSLLGVNANGNILVGTTSDNGYTLQNAGNTTFAGQFVQGGGSGRSTNGTTVAFTNNTTFSANSDIGDGARFLSIVNESTAVSAFSNICFRINPASGGSSGNVMLDMKFVNNGSVTSTLYWTFLHGGSWSDRMSLTSAGALTAASFFESSDARLKSNIINLDVDVRSIVAKHYTKEGVEEIGYLAQDVESILPSAVSKRKDGYLDLSYRQVHTAKIAYLEKRINELEQQLKNK